VQAESSDIRSAHSSSMAVFFLLATVVAAIASSSSSNNFVDGFQIMPQNNNHELFRPKNMLLLKSSRRDVILTTITTTSSLLLLTTQPVQAKDESMNYQAVWFDPKHPNGYRILFGNDQKATLLLKNEPSEEELVFPVKVIKEEGKETNLVFDFFGKKVVEGIFTRNRDKIRIISFDNNNNNNNYWMNKTFEGPIGVYKDSTNSKRVIIIRQINNNKGSDCVVEFRDDGDNNNVTSTFTAKAGNTFTFFNFPDGRGEVTAVFSLFRRTLTFDDGTVWTKY
jgi:hypothetical protein